MRLSLYEVFGGHGEGCLPPGDTLLGDRVVYDVGRGDAHVGDVVHDGHVLVWQLEESEQGGEGALLSHAVELDPAADWIARCDRIDFPPGGVAYTHTHPGPGIRYLLHGELEIRTGGRSVTHGPGGAWFESGLEPVYAAAATDGETAFVRVLLLPAVWAGKRTIRYIDPADEDRPKLQRPTVFFDHPLPLR